MDIILLVTIFFIVIFIASLFGLYCKFVFAETTAINIASAITGNVIDVKKAENELTKTSINDKRMKSLENIIEYFGDNKEVTFNGAEIENILKNI